MKRYRLAPVALSLALAIAVALVPALAARQEPAPDARLARLLERAKEYCLKLERAALDFTCIEKIEEKTYAEPGYGPNPSFLDLTSMAEAAAASKRAYVNTLVYDYQFVRMGDKKKEQRILIEENGRRMQQSDAELATMAMRVENALFGPIGLLGAEWQPYHDYKIVDEETHKGKKVAIVEAAAKRSLDRPHCVGRVWIQEDDGSILKIAWDQSSVGSFELILKQAAALQGEPRLTSVTEYGMAKKGIRFPSKDTTEEAYLLAGGVLHVRSTTTILYKDYKFFTVETEVGY